MRVAVFYGGRQLAPVMNGFVLVFALPQDGRLAARLISRAEKCRGVDRRCGRDQKTATGQLHGHPLYLRATAAFSSTSLGSANCNQKPIISSSLGSPQRMAFEGSGFWALSNELSKYAVVTSFVPLGSRNWCFRK